MASFCTLVVHKYHLRICPQCLFAYLMLVVILPASLAVAFHILSVTFFAVAVVQGTGHEVNPKSWTGSLHLSPVPPLRVLPSVALGCLHIASAIPTKSQHAALNVIVLFIFTFSVNSSANILLFSKNISFARQFYKYQLLSLSNFIKDNAKNLQLSDKTINFTH